MINKRLVEHPILDCPEREKVSFYWMRSTYFAYKGEMLSSALIANGFDIFGHHRKDDSAIGLFCANGQCANCMVLVNGKPVKACMTEVQANMIVERLDWLPEMPLSTRPIEFKPLQVLQTEVLIIGGGPAGLSASLEFEQYQINHIIVDDKPELGGKLNLQTHKFFGSLEDSYAGTRGIEIGKKLAQKVMANQYADVWTNSTVLYIFKDQKVGVLKKGEYCLLQPKIILNAAGAREKFLRFAGNKLVGIYGAGAFQTLVNRDLVQCSQRLFIIGGGNVGIIAAYHALQAGIEVVGLAEALPKCGGYKVHADKLKRLGVPIYTSHTIISAHGKERVDSITIGEVDSHMKIIPKTEKSFACDTILIAVGLDSLNEFTSEAKLAGMKVFAAGDAREIAEASSAMFNGRIEGFKIAQALGKTSGEIPSEWYEKADVLKAPPGKILAYQNGKTEAGIYPIIHCLEEIPCNPCTSICQKKLITIPEQTIIGQPRFKGSCMGCMQCVLICPGLAISLVDFRADRDHPFVYLPYEFPHRVIRINDLLEVVDIEAQPLGQFPVADVLNYSQHKMQIIKIKMPKDLAPQAIGFRLQKASVTEGINRVFTTLGIEDTTMVCLCERVSVAEVKGYIKKGITDFNQLKAITRIGMGACNGKTCENLMKQLLRQEGIKPEDQIPHTRRPLFVEVLLEKFALENVNEMSSDINSATGQATSSSKNKPSFT